MTRKRQVRWRKICNMWRRRLRGYEPLWPKSKRAGRKWKAVQL